MLERILGWFRLDHQPPDEIEPGRARDLTPDEVGVPNPRLGFAGNTAPRAKGQWIDRHSRIGQPPVTRCPTRRGTGCSSDRRDLS